MGGGTVQARQGLRIDGDGFTRCGATGKIFPLFCIIRAFWANFTETWELTLKEQALEIKL